MKKSKKKEQEVPVKEFKMVDMIDFPTRGREVYIRATVDELRGDRIICRNKHGYYWSMAAGDVYVRQTSTWIQNGRKFECQNCGNEEKTMKRFCSCCGAEMTLAKLQKPVEVI